MELSRIAEDQITAIESDKMGRSQWEQMRARCVELLGLKLEDPKGDVSRSSNGMSTSVVRDPILLEAVERGRANAYAELCPSGGPVKVVNFSDDQTGETVGLAEALQKDMNYYLTTTASEYYPDTRYMLWWTYLTSGTFKKVYKCPLRKRPVSEYVDGTELIVSADATDLKNAARVTHESKVARNVMRAMQLEGVYRDVRLGEPEATTINAVDAKVANISGVSAQSQRPEDEEYTVYECYCNLDIKGFEHKQDGKITGLPLPYCVTIEANSREVLAVRRNWDIEDEDEVYRPPNIPFVLFPYSTGISRIYGCGLGQMLGNMASALTALLRISIDNGVLSNYPGLLKAKGTGRQLTNELMVPPGGCAEIDTGGLPIQQTVMGMPFKDVSSAVVALIEQTRNVGQRLAGTADLPVGEGKQDAPVGTTLAMIEQGTKIESSVHKALYAAQSEEFRLLVKLFQRDPEALWRGNRRPAFGNAQDNASRQARLDKFKRALDNCDIQPMADPNVPSDMHRNLMMAGLIQSTMGDPAWDQTKVKRQAFKQMFKMSDSDMDALMAPPQQGPPPMDPVAQATLQIKQQELQLQQARLQVDASGKDKDRQLKENLEATKLAADHIAKTQQEAQTPEQPSQPDPLQVAALQLKQQQVNQSAQKMQLDAHNAHQDREARTTEKAMDIAARMATHPESQPVVNTELQDLSTFLVPPNQTMAQGGAVKPDDEVHKIFMELTTEPDQAKRVLPYEAILKAWRPTEAAS